MHIPDGFIAPQMYLPAYGAAAGLWAIGLKRLRSSLHDETIPRLAVLTAFSFVAMTVMLPIPGGTSAHASGIAVLALIFGVWTAFMAVSVVLLLQAVLLGAGGITTLPLNALAIGLVGSAAAVFSHRIFRPLHEDLALLAAGWFSVTVPSFLIAVLLGLQPLIAHNAEGQPLFFPFGLSITIPAVLVPNAIIGIGEGVLTLLVIRFVRQRNWFPQP